MNEFISEMDNLKKKIESFPLKVDKGTKKMKEDFHKTKVEERNSLVKSEIEKYKKTNNQIKERLEGIKNSLIPEDKKIDYKTLLDIIDTKKNELIKINDFATEEDKLGLTKIITCISDLDDGNLDKINKMIKKYIDRLASIGINLKEEDFNYTLYTSIYMKSFLENINNPSFKDLMRKTFDNIYWSCPNIIYELKFMLKNIADSHQKEIKNKFNSISKKDNIYEEYKESINSYKETIFNDKYNLIKPFIDGTKKPEEYTLDSASRAKAFDRFLVSGTFESLEEENKEKYYKDINKIKYLVEELEEYNIFKPFIDEIVKRYKNKDNLKDVFKNKDKEIKKFESERKKVVSKILPHKTLFKYVDNTKNEKLILKENEVIKNLISNLDEYESNKTDDIIITTLKDTSTYLDIIKLLASNYMVYMVLYKALKLEVNSDDLYEKLVDYANNPNISFTDDINILNELEISDIISNKYKLLGINLLKEDITNGIDSLKSDIEFLNDVKNIESSGIKFEDLVLINEISSLENE